MEITVEQILAANPGLRTTTNIEAGVPRVKPETGAQLFIPDGKRALLEDLKAKARRGDVEMQYALAVRYEQGRDVPQDYVEAARWYKRAAKRGHGRAQFWLGSLYDSGLGVKKDSAQGVKWLTRSATNGCAQGQYFLGKRYRSGDGVPKDSATAVKWYQAAAGQGVPWAQFELGGMYYNGAGVARDHSQTFYWTEEAAVKGLAEAQALLGSLYASGDGVERDDAEAFKWLNRAAVQGLADAQSAVGEMYVEGVGVEKDPVQAYKWLTVAAGSDVEAAKTNLTGIESKMSAEELAQARRLAGEFKPYGTNSPRCSWSGEQRFSLQPESGMATGFFVTDDGYLVSNYHVVKDAGEIFLVTSIGTIAAAVVKVDEASDLALLKAAGQFSALPVADSQKVRLGSPVITVGFPDPPLMGFSAKFARGDIAALAGLKNEPVRFQLSVPIQPGNSGGALLDSCGNVVGIVSQKINPLSALESNGNLPENVNYAIKSRYLLRLLESVPELSTKLKACGTEPKNVEEIASEGERSSVLILIYGGNR